MQHGLALVTAHCGRSRAQQQSAAQRSTWDGEDAGVLQQLQAVEGVGGLALLLGRLDGLQATQCSGWLLDQHDIHI